ncbi:hypothetical protein K8942_00790 [Candidatus Peribacteria bacterium]|nr:MAG: hypothetical protein K8942_00790 [Candidatus Peribacteria bacterium]
MNQRRGLALAASAAFAEKKHRSPATGTEFQKFLKKFQPGQTEQTENNTPESSAPPKGKTRKSAKTTRTRKGRRQTAIIGR